MESVNNVVEPAVGAGRFRAPFYLKNPVLQTIVSSLKFQNKKKEQFDHASVRKIIDAGNGIRLEGFYSENTDSIPVKNNQPGSGKKKLIILIHGWEGSENSSYMVKGGRFFYRLGYSVFRLNMRDHGNSHSLNTGLFYGTLIDEVFSSVKYIAGNFGKDSDIYIAGFSIGANFALRIASLAGSDELLGSSLNLVFAVNPPLNPLTATARIDRYFIIRKYFLRKWKKSLQKKENVFPDLYRFSELPEYDSCMDLTAVLLGKYSEFKNIEDYFSCYTLKRDFFAGIKIPVSVITAEDDPIIDSKDFEEIKEADNPFIELTVEKHGGHCGYIKNLKTETWIFDKIAETINRH